MTVSARSPRSPGKSSRRKRPLAAPKRPLAAPKRPLAAPNRPLPAPTGPASPKLPHGLPTSPSWDLYRTFLGVVRLGSLSAAARDLGLTQPTVGRHVDALEAAVGAELFTRSQTGLLPTDLARELAPYAAELASTAASLARAASARRDEVAGTVRISASEVVATEVLPPILADLHDAHPALRIELSASDQVEDLLHRAADIAVRQAPPAQSALVVRRIGGGIPVGMFAHRRYLDRHGTPRTVADLAHHRLIGYDRETAYIRAMARRHPAFASLSFTFRADSNLAQLAAIRAGIGIGFCQRGLASPDLIHLLPRSFELTLDTHVAMHENLRASARCRAVFSALVTGLTAYIDRT
ncbi:MAG: LysR family transcriptional regulator [Deltaproteobacteria bacterium]|nr:LysR family transcriptional regulator [Deltaproteobacteria bacterium]